MADGTRERERRGGNGVARQNGVDGRREPPHSDWLSDLAAAREDVVARTLFVTSVPPSTNYSGGLFILNMLRALEFRVGAMHAVMNPVLEPEVPPDARECASITTADRPNEAYHGVDDPARIAASEAVAAARVSDEIAPDVLGRAERVDSSVIWIILEGQTMIRLADALIKRSRRPVVVQVMDPPLNWFRAHGLDDATTRSLLAVYDSVLRRSSACAAASWTMAKRYREAYEIPTAAVMPSLPRDVADGAAEKAREPGTFTIGVAGQMYAAAEWRALLDACSMLDWRVADRTIQIHVFLHPLYADLLERGTNVTVHDWQPTERLVPVLKSMDLLYCPYRFGADFAEESELCFPSKLTTYLACGVPILFHGPGEAAPARFLENNRAALTCDSLDAAELAAQLVATASEQEPVPSIARNGRRAFERHLTHERLADAIRGLVLTAADSTVQPPPRVREPAIPPLLTRGFA